MLIQNLRVIFNPGLCFDDQLHSVIQMPYFYLRNAARLLFVLSQGNGEMLIHSWVTSWLDSSHCLLTALTGRAMNTLQLNPNSSAKLPPETKRSCLSFTSLYIPSAVLPQLGSVLILTIPLLILNAVHLSDPSPQNTLLQAQPFSLLLVDCINDPNKSKEQAN